MRLSSIFRSRKQTAQPSIAFDSLRNDTPQTFDSLRNPPPPPKAIEAYRGLSKLIEGKTGVSDQIWFLPTQAEWLKDPHPLKIWEKSRQTGGTTTDAFDSVMKASPAGARFDVWVTSRDEIQARLYLEDCRDWAKFLHLAATDLGVVILDARNKFSAQVLQFANGRRIYCLSSNPNALAGKRGHVKIDEFALHPDQRLLYKIAKPVTQWGGTMSILSTHRGPNTLFNQMIEDIRHRGNPMGFHLFSYPLQKAVAEGLVGRINEKSGRNETDEEFLRRTRAECIDEDQWNQEYCCIPCEESAAFLTHDLLTACEDPTLKLMTFEQLLASVRTLSTTSATFPHPPCLYLGMDVARKDNLCVIDVGEQIGDVMWDRLRIELRNKSFSEIEFELYRLLALPQLKRACIDATGMGMHLAERARERFGWKVEEITFTTAVKEDLAFNLRRDFEDRTLRIVRDDNLRSDLRALKKHVTTSGNIRFAGEAEGTHCDRFWAKALRQHAAAPREEPWALVC